MALRRRLQIINGGAAMGIEGEEAAMVRIAFTTASRERVDQHFGTTQALLFYGVTTEAIRLLEISEFTTQEAMDGNEEKLAARLQSLTGTVRLYSQAVGASAIRQLQALGVQPVKVAAGSPIRGLLEAVQQELRHDPEGRLARALQPRSPERFAAMAAEEWQE